MHQYINASLCQCIQASLHQCILASMHLCINTSMHLCINASIHPAINASVHQWIQASMHQCICYLYINASLHIQSCLMHWCRGIDASMHPGIYVDVPLSRRCMWHIQLLNKVYYIYILITIIVTMQLMQFSPNLFSCL